MRQGISPYVCHVFVCTNDRANIQKACADGASLTLHHELQEKIKEHGLQEQVRISQAGCFGACRQGPNVVIYPQDIWFSDATPAHINDIIGTIEMILEKQK